MNLREVFKQHKESKAELTVACNCVLPEETAGFGIMSVDKDGRINNFIEKPKDLSMIDKMAISRDGKKLFLGSMGIYLFNKSALVDLLTKDYKVDFGKEIIPEAIHKKETYAYMFDGYWRDIGTINSFYKENMMLTEAIPPLDMYDETWPIFTRPRYLSPAKIEYSQIERSLISEGAIIQSSKISHSIVGLRFRISAGCTIKDTIIMGSDYYETQAQIDEDHAKVRPLLGLGKNCHIERAIIDKNVRIGDNVRITNGKNLEDFDGPNYFIRDGIVIVSKNTVIPSGTVI
jgi:glucose-1-phosphate adenylyltransferase